MEIVAPEFVVAGTLAGTNVTVTLDPVEEYVGGIGETVVPLVEGWMDVELLPRQVWTKRHLLFLLLWKVFKQFPQIVDFVFFLNLELQ